MTSSLSIVEMLQAFTILFALFNMWKEARKNCRIHAWKCPDVEKTELPKKSQKVNKLCG